jgi:methionyl aminopeptidase
VNDEIVHGIPGPRVLAAGDLVSVDCGAVVAGWHGDAAFSALVPGAEGDATDRDLVATAERALWHGIAAMGSGKRLNAIGAAVEDLVAGRFGLVEDYGGHGIGTAMHQDPHVLNYRTRERGPRLRPGVCLAIEPMLTAGDPATRVLDDDWTVVTADGRRAAHWEHSVALHEGGLWVLTAPDGGESGLASVGGAAPSRFAPLAD